MKFPRTPSSLSENEARLCRPRPAAASRTNPKACEIIEPRESGLRGAMHGGARRSRRFNSPAASGLRIFCIASVWMLKRAEARAPSPDGTSLNHCSLRLVCDTAALRSFQISSSAFGLSPMGESGAKATAVQTLRAVWISSDRAERLDCGWFTAAFHPPIKSHKIIWHHPKF